MTRRYPIGIQTFEKIRKENYLYIDKTDLVWQLTKVSHNYALPYSTDQRKVVIIGAQFDRDTMTVGEYIIEH